MRTHTRAILGSRKADLEEIGGKKMKKSDMLPVIAAAIIAILVVPTGAFATTPAAPTGYFASVVTIPEDNAKLNMGMMVLGIDPTSVENLLLPGQNWYSESTCTTKVSAATPGWSTSLLGVVVGAEVTSEPVTSASYWGLVYFYQPVSTLPGAACVKHTFLSTANIGTNVGGMDLLSQHKMLATLNGVPTAPDYLFCEIVEKEKAKIPPQTTKSPSKRQFPDEVIKTTLQDVTSNFICKFRTVKPGVYALDVYFIGPQVAKFIADHMLIVTVGYKVGTKTIWASDLQDICILGWATGNNAQVLAISLFLPYGLSTGAYTDTYYSWIDPMGSFVSCDEAAAWQLTWLTGGWPYSTN
jgi:hypothetical protein